MKFDLKQPCGNCPFRRDCLPEWLGQERAEGIIGTIENGGTFQCHKTKTANSQHCAGALILAKKAFGGFNGLVSLACATGRFDCQALDLNAPVFETPGEFIEHHSGDDE